ncbi:MAG: hypothetical protein ABIV48_04825 [Pyrinomonadaceae bacterium]
MEQLLSTIRSYAGYNTSQSLKIEYRSVSSEIRRTPQNINISLTPNRVAGFLGAITLLLIAASVGLLIADYFTGYSSMIIHKLVKLFNLDLEVNVPTFFSVLLLTSASALLAVVTFNRFKQRLSQRYLWAILSLGFLFMAFDEMASVHERLIEPTREIMGIENLGLFYYAWVIPAFGLIAVLGLAYLKFLIDLPKPTRFYFLLAATMFLGGAVGLELLEGVYGTGTLMYNIFVTCEEALEMGGVIVLIWSLLGFIGNSSRDAGVKFDLSRHDALSDKNWTIRELGVQS